MYMKRRLFAWLLATIFLPTMALAQKVDPKAYFTDSKGYDQETTKIEADDGEAPLTVTFRSNPTEMDGWTPSYEWHFRKAGQAGDLFVRYEEDTEYTFVESGTFNIVQKTFVSNGTFENELDSTTITVTIAESKLEFPNAFSPNGDDRNEYFQAKEGYKSIISFKATIFNRWGQKLYEWDSPAGKWDGKYHGSDVKEGVYFLMVKAKGADGKVYDIRKDINLLRGYTEKTNNN